MSRTRIYVLLASLVLAALPPLVTEGLLRSGHNELGKSAIALDGPIEGEPVVGPSPSGHVSVTREMAWPYSHVAALPPAPSPAPSPTPDIPSRPPVNDPRVLERLRGFILPIKGARLPTRDNYLPGAPRPYRAGTHESIDFYDGDAGVRVTFGTEVLAVQDGVVVRADLEYRENTREEMRQLLAIARAEGHTPPEVLDRLRGRQVIIEHGDGVVTHYSHLQGIAPGIYPGVRVQRGQVIGYVGNSGTPEAAIGNDVGPHLDLEIRIDGKYLGWGLSLPETRLWLERIFAQP